jgi:hypothetical protein
MPGDCDTARRYRVRRPQATPWAAVFSPDDRYVAYTLVASGSEVYVAPFPRGDERWLVSGGTGEEPQWLDSQLVFRRGEDWYGVAYDASTGFAFAAPRLLFSGPYLNVRGMEYRVFADGSMVPLEPENPDRSTDRLTVVVNWLDHVRQRLEVDETH